ncbi:MAG TPA: NADH-quinone oxidoreductase subunit J [Nitrospiraceae bacterium]|nr:NADH-quinone oxidoreductase subunit J [Nitrospiraceae bacterium]
MTTPQLFFAYFAVAMTVLSLLVVTRRSPVHSIMWMLVLFIHIAALYLFLNAEFLAAIQIIVYAGAILVLFLFVIMMLNLKKEETAKKYQAQWPVSAGIAIILAAFLVLILGKIVVLPSLGEYSIEAVKTEGIMMTTGKVLYTEFLLPFEIASIVLLVAIIGAVVLAKKRIE